VIAFSPTIADLVARRRLIRQRFLASGDSPKPGKIASSRRLSLEYFREQKL